MRYLSDEWFEAADAAVGTASPAPAELIIDQHVDDDVVWRVVVGRRSSIRRHSSSPEMAAPHAVFRQSRSTASAIASGEKDSHQAFLLGEVQFEGDIDRLIEGRQALDWLHAALEPVMARTVFD